MKKIGLTALGTSLIATSAGAQAYLVVQALHFQEKIKVLRKWPF